MALDGAGCEYSVSCHRREPAMKKIMFIAFVVNAGLAVILDDGRARPNRRRH